MTSYQRFNLLNHGKWIVIIITSMFAVICLIVIVECYRRHNKPKQASPTNKGMDRDRQSDGQGSPGGLDGQILMGILM